MSLKMKKSLTNSLNRQWSSSTSIGSSRSQGQRSKNRNNIGLSTNSQKRKNCVLCATTNRRNLRVCENRSWSKSWIVFRTVSNLKRYIWDKSIPSYHWLRMSVCSRLSKSRTVQSKKLQKTVIKTTSSPTIPKTQPSSAVSTMSRSQIKKAAINRRRMLKTPNSWGNSLSRPLKKSRRTKQRKKRNWGNRNWSSLRRTEGRPRSSLLRSWRTRRRQWPTILTLFCLACLELKFNDFICFRTPYLKPHQVLFRSTRHVSFLKSYLNSTDARWQPPKRDYPVAVSSTHWTVLLSFGLHCFSSVYLSSQQSGWSSNQSRSCKTKRSHYLAAPHCS